MVGGVREFPKSAICFTANWKKALNQAFDFGPKRAGSPITVHPEPMLMAWLIHLEGWHTVSEANRIFGFDSSNR